MLKIHVSGTGDDTNPGTAEKPLATIAGARDRLRDMRRSGKLPEGAAVTLHAGTYRQSESFRLESEDSGTAAGPVVFRTAPGEAVTLSGGVELPAEAWQPVADPAMLARLPAAARPHVRVADFGLASAAGSVSVAPRAAEITCNGTPLTLARWPKAGYARLAGQPAVTTPDGTPRAAKLEDGFLYTGDRPSRWQEPGEAWIHVWGNDWATARVQVAGIDLARRHALTRAPYGSQYGFPKNGRFFWFNILEELNEPGEYILDRKSGRLYVWLPEGSLPSSLECATLDQPLVELHDASHIRFEGIAFRHGRSHGLTIRGGSDVAVTACRVSCLGGSGIVVEGGRRHAVRGCEVAYLGGCGISLSGGDRRTLERADHAAENNHVHHFAMWAYCYNAGVHVGGGSYGSLMGSVGIRIAHNRIHDCPHNGILYWGNDLEIENNDIYRVVMESTDAGAIYTGRDFARRGSLIRHNHLHHNGTGGPFGTMGIYLDDCAGGEQVVGNLLEGHRQAIYMGGGTDTVCENNLLVNCDPALHLDMRGILSGLTNICRERFYEVNAHLPPYSTHYPELAKIHAHYEKGEGVPPEGTRVCRNLAAGGDFWSYTSKGVDRNCLIEENNLTDLAMAELDPQRGGLRAGREADERRIGFERIPVERIGLVRDPQRPTVPPLSLLDCQLILDTPWTWRDNAVTAPMMRLEVVNAGGTRERGVVELFASPAEEAAIRGNPRLAFDLAPGETIRSAPLALTPAAGLAHLELGVRRLGTVDLPVWHWLYLQHTVTAPRLGAIATAEAAAAALAGLTPLRTPAWDGSRGAVRLGLTDSGLAIAFDLDDCDLRPRLDDTWWQEACIELFGFGPAHPATEQIGLVPSGAGLPAGGVLRYHDSIRQPEAPGAQLVCEARPEGYRLSALIPDRLLGWDRSKAAPTLEISINSKPWAGAARERVRVFGVEIWQNERHRFATLVSPSGNI